MCAAQKTLEGWNWESESYAVATNWAYMGATGDDVCDSQARCR